jgi:acetate CoA/acetoacetate CoA-transferase alpha subunit
MKNKVVGVEQAAEFIKDGMTVMIGGFLGVGSPHAIIDAMIKKGVKDITLISNDTGITGSGVSKLIAAKTAKRAIVSHIGTNPETGKQMIAGELDVQLTPQGTMAERIRAAGVGLGGVLTPTGVGTSIAEGKQVMTVDGKQYLLELPLKADLALLRGSVVDTFGNTMYRGTSQNFNKVMAMAADLVIMEAGEVVETGQLDPNCVMTSGIFIDYVVKGEPSG